MRCIRKDCLHCINLCFILLKTRFHRINRKSRNHSLSSIHSRIHNVIQLMLNCHLHIRELLSHSVYAPRHSGEIHLICRRLYIFKPFGGTVEFKSPFELFECCHTCFDVVLKIGIVKSHLNNSLINSCTHNLVTSPQAFSTILSKIGWIAGLM